MKQHYNRAFSRALRVSSGERKKSLNQFMVVVTTLVRIIRTKIHINDLNSHLISDFHHTFLRQSQQLGI